MRQSEGQKQLCSLVRYEKTQRPVPEVSQLSYKTVASTVKMTKTCALLQPRKI